MKVSIIGTGYVGLVSGVCLAEKGHDVICVDVDKKKVDTINGGKTPIFEVGLEELLKKNIGKGLKATSDLKGAVLSTEITLIAVGTPFDGERIDLTFIRQVSRQIGEVLAEKDDYHVVVVKSTVVPGTTDHVVLRILEDGSGKKAGKDFGVGMNPEFLAEGVAIKDFMQPDRIIIGGMDERTIKVQAGLYDGFEKADFIYTNNKTAEMAKYTSNAMLATMISFSNEIGNLCARLEDVDVADVMHGVHLSRHVSPLNNDGSRGPAPMAAFLWPGCGFGGSCLPKDAKALVSFAEKAGQPMRLLDTVIRINQVQPNKIISILKDQFTSLECLRVGILGLSFKPSTDDMRESPSIPIIKDLLAEGAKIKGYDPIATDTAKEVFGDLPIDYVAKLEHCLEDIDVAVLVTRWEEFERVPELLSKMKSPPLLVDGRRMLDKNTVARYDGIGL
jgi:UDPglucose 6-dehydrogenase/GDP-mannose 6-dehydrogenase